MPFAIERRGKKWVVVNKATGRVAGTHPSSRKARKQLAAMAKNGVDLSGRGEKRS